MAIKKDEMEGLYKKFLAENSVQNYFIVSTLQQGGILFCYKKLSLR